MPAFAEGILAGVSAVSEDPGRVEEGFRVFEVSGAMGFRPSPV
jgi:hypothetical protein